MFSFSTACSECQFNRRGDPLDMFWPQSVSSSTVSFYCSTGNTSESRGRSSGPRIHYPTGSERSAKRYLYRSRRLLYRSRVFIVRVPMGDGYGVGGHHIPAQEGEYVDDVGQEETGGHLEGRSGSSDRGTHCQESQADADCRPVDPLILLQIIRRDHPLYSQGQHREVLQ